MHPQPITEAFSGHFKKVSDFRAHIVQLQNAWDSLALLAQLSGTGSEMEQTRAAFNQISSDVLQFLSEETLNKTVSQCASKASVIINLLVRNLFERTADIGFFATDDDVRDYLTQRQAGNLTEALQQNMVFRFEEYQKKYTVYENIVLFDHTGHIVHQLNPHHAMLHDEHPIFAMAMRSQAPYVEQFYETELHGRVHKSLKYAHVVRSHDGRSILGVLCLCFKFVNELDTIFGNLIDAQDWSIGLLLDEDRHVIASSDPYQIPIGATLCADPQRDWFITRFAGREYLAVTRQSEGYQGYLGPGWLGQVMIPLTAAFDHNTHALVAHIDPALLKKVMRSPLIFSESLLNIPKQAASIQSKLNQSVWNGNIWQSNYVDTQQKNFSKTLLSEISNTGRKTQLIIEQMVSELYQTVVSVMLENSSFYAQLAVDILDRNLYERANDVRWWALHHGFRELLAKPQLTADDKANMTRVLQTINSLYTVYDNLMLFDRQGEVVAVSNPRYQSLIGSTPNEEWFVRTRGCQTTQAYVVSRFAPTMLYRDSQDQAQSAYIYAAPVRELSGAGMVGAIGIVFDCKPQLQAMLNDVLPRDANHAPVPGSFTLFVSEQQNVIASTHADFAIGDPFVLMPQISQLNEGEHCFDIAEYANTYYAVGAHAAYGYREYKGAQDSYRNKVIALIFTPLGDVGAINTLIAAEAQVIHNQFNPNVLLVPDTQAKEYATFYVGNTWLGIAADYVVEACDETQLRTLPAPVPFIAGMHPHRGAVIPVIDLAQMLGLSDYHTEHRQMVVIHDEVNQLKFAVFVSALGEIPYLMPAQMQAINQFFAAKSHNPGVAIATLTQSPPSQSMLTLVTPQSIWEKVSPPPFN